MKDGDVWYLRDPSFCHQNRITGAPFNPRRCVVCAGDEWPLWAVQGQTELSRVVGDQPDSLDLSEPTKLEFLVNCRITGGAEILDGGTHGLSLGACRGIEIAGFQVQGNGKTQVPSQNYGIQLDCCDDVQVVGCSTVGCTSGVDLEAGGRIDVIDHYSMRDGFAITLGHGVGWGPYRVERMTGEAEDGGLPLGCIGATGWPGLPVIVTTDNSLRLVGRS